MSEREEEKRREEGIEGDDGEEGIIELTIL